MTLQVIPATQKTDAPHLSSEELAELLDCQGSTTGDATSSLARTHLAGCPLCAAEYAEIKTSLALFREATRAYADREFKPMDHPAKLMPATNTLSFQPVWWAAAAAVLLAIGLLPLQMHRQQVKQLAQAPVAMSAPESAAESDEALLDGIDRDLSVSVPGAMQSLDAPAGSTSATSYASSTSISDQRNN